MTRSSPSSTPGAHDGGPDRGTSVARLSLLRARLEQQRDFRRGQLADLHARRTDMPRDDHRSQATASALREVDDLVASFAHRALTDIELALVRMRTGRYGYCRSCNARIPMALLESIPKTTLCLACQQPTEDADVDRHRDRRAPVRFDSAASP
jgi:DnaK suppressor protein